MFNYKNSELKTEGNVLLFLEVQIFNFFLKPANKFLKNIYVQISWSFY